MDRKVEKQIIKLEMIKKYADYLHEQEKAPSTIQKYIHDLVNLKSYLDQGVITKKDIIEWKEKLSQTYAVSSVNTMLAAANGFLTFMGWHDLKVKPLKIQRKIFSQEEKELTYKEYVRLVDAAKRKHNIRLSLLLQTICSTGIRVSELQYITMEAVYMGRVDVNCKGKRRIVFLPDKLRHTLKKYLKQQKRSSGPVFTTKNGKPLDRSNIWREMKAICESADVNPGKVFPHNLRHLFAKTYYSLEKDLSRLADILGHTNINTTRIYTIESGSVHAKQMERMGLIIT